MLGISENSIDPNALFDLPVASWAKSHFPAQYTLVSINSNGAKKPVSALIFVESGFRVSLLSYLVPANMRVAVGNAVEVPFGTSSKRGLVVSFSSEKGKASKPITQVWGVRAKSSEIELALSVAKHHFVSPEKVLVRLSPRTGKGAEPLEVGKLALRSGTKNVLPTKFSNRQVIVPGPSLDLAVVAAQEAMRLNENGQVLILCPTVESVNAVHAMFSGGAVKLDAKALRGSWVAFRDGKAQVGVGTRSAALYSGDHLGSIIVVDDTHPGHEEIAQPYTHARDLALARSRVSNLKISLISPVPSAQALEGTRAAYPVGTWPKVTIADRSENGHLTAAVCPGMGKAISRANKAHRSSLVLASASLAVRRCATCGAVRQCEECSETRCAHLTECTACGNKNTRVSGWDEKRLREIFGKDVNIGSAFGSRTTVATTVVAFDVDAMLYAPGLYPNISAARYLWQAGMLAGGRGELVIGTTHTENQVLRDLAANRGLLPTARGSAAEALAGNLPPYGRLITVTLQRKTKPNVASWPGSVSSPRLVKPGLWEVLVRISKEEFLLLEPIMIKARKNSKAKIRVS